jgi:hypothetical protein
MHDKKCLIFVASISIFHSVAVAKASGIMLSSSATLAVIRFVMDGDIRSRAEKGDAYAGSVPSKVTPESDHFAIFFASRIQ